METSADSTGQIFLDTARYYLSGEYLPKIRRAVGVMSDADVWWRPNPESNSVGNLLLHLSGNMRQWVISGVGRRPDTRRRQEEFAAGLAEGAARPGKTALVGLLESTLAEADEVLAECPPDALPRASVFQGKEMTVLEGVFHAVEHFSTHTGQILYVAKLRTGIDLRFYEIEKGVAKHRW